MHREREGEAGNPGPSEEQGPQGEEDEILILEQLNITSAQANKGALLKRKAMITAIQEQCLNPGQIKSMQAAARAVGKHF